LLSALFVLSRRPQSIAGAESKQYRAFKAGNALLAFAYLDCWSQAAVYHSGEQVAGNHFQKKPRSLWLRGGCCGICF